MSTRLLMTFMVSMMVNAVVFGVGAIAVLAMPSLQPHAMALMPWVVLAAFTVGPAIAWFLAPSMLARRGERQEGAVRLAEGERYPVAAE